MKSSGSFRQCAGRAAFPREAGVPAALTSGDRAAQLPDKRAAPHSIDRNAREPASATNSSRISPIMHGGDLLPDGAQVGGRRPQCSILDIVVVYDIIAT